MFDFDADTYDGDIFDLDIGRLNQMADFVVTIGEPNRGKEPENLLETKEANEALESAYRYACQKQDSSTYAINAKVYIEAIENLRFWRGDEAKKSKQILKDYIDERKGY